MTRSNKNAGEGRNALIASAVAAAVASWTASAAAQDQAAGASQNARVLGPVRVGGEAVDGYKVDSPSSPKQTAPLLDTPQTISVISQPVIREQGARNLTDVLRNTPGISFNAGENGFSSSTNNFSLRGLDTSGSIFIDDARDSGSYSRDIFNIERVEVVKGAAADNGRGSAAGYINLVTKTPSLENFIAGEVQVGFDEYGSKARKRATADANYVVGDTTAVRLNLLLEDSGVAGRKLARKESWGVAPSLSYGLGTDFRFTAAYEHVENDDRPDWGVPGPVLDGAIIGTHAFNPATAGAKRNRFYGLRSDFDDTQVDSVLARFEYDVADGVTVSNQTRWARIDREARFTVPTGVDEALQATTQTQAYDRLNKSLSNLTNLSAVVDTGPIRHTVSAGFEYTKEQSDARRFGTVNTVPTDVFNPDPARAWADSGLPPAASETAHIDVETIAFYLYDTAEFSEQFEITGGIRAEGYQVDLDSLDLAGQPTGIGHFEDSQFALNGKIGVVYKPAPNGSVYVSFGTSTLPPGSYLSNPDISRTGDNVFPGFVAGAKAVRSYNYEAGLKWAFFDDRLLTTAALFHTEKKRMPILGLDDDEVSLDLDPYLKGYGKQVVQGLEVGVTGQITDAWNVFGGFVIMDSKRKHSDYLDRVLYNGRPGDRGNDPTISVQGDRLAFTPNFTANLWTAYRLPIGLTLGGGVRHVGSSFLGRPDDAVRVIPNGRVGKLESYTVVDAMLAYEVTEAVEVRLNVDNVLNEKYAISTNWPGSRALLGPSRAFLVSLGFQL